MAYALVRVVDDERTIVIQDADRVRQLVDEAEDAVTDAEGHATAAAASASAAASSASASAASAGVASDSAIAAGNSETNAETSADDAEVQATAAAASAAAAAASAAAADLSEAGAASALAGVLAELDGVTITTAMFNVANRAMMQALDHTQGFPATLLQDGGVFVPTAGNFTTQVAADAGQAKYVPWSTGAANGAWVRIDPDWWTPEMAQCAGDGVADDGPKIKYLLTLGNVRCKPNMVYGTASPIAVPSNRTLWLNGATIKALATFANATVSGNTINAPVYAHTTTGVRILGPGVIDSNKVGFGGGDAARKNGIMLVRSRGFLVHGVTARNGTGYLFYTTGVSSNRSSGKFELCHAENGQYHYEFMGSDDITVDRCTSSDGDGDITCSAFIHPVFGDIGSSRIRILNFYGKGVAGAAIGILGNASLSNNDISFTDCHFELTTASNYCLVMAGSAGSARIKAVNSTFISLGQGAIGVDKLTESTFQGCKLYGKTICVEFGPGSDIKFDNCQFTTFTTPGAAGFGIAASGGLADTTSRVEVRGSTFNISSDSGEFVAAGPCIHLDRSNAFNFGTRPDEPCGQRTVTGLSNHWLLMEDQNRTIVMSWAGNNQDVWVYADSVIRLPIGTKIDIVNGAPAGRTLTVNPDSGAVTINKVGGVATIKPWGTATLEKVAANTWTLSGALGT
jgi:hypothetical protein